MAETLARDGLETAFAEKLWALVPEVHRYEDGDGVLRALVETIAGQAAVLRRSHDRLWDDQFVELCDDWAVPYLGDLVATRLVSVLAVSLRSPANDLLGFELNTLPAGLGRRGRRVDVANTIAYRRRAGTLTVLEQLAADIAGWEGTAVEGFRRLARARHGLDPPPPVGAGRLSGTPAGGVADLRRPGVAELVGGPFDEFRHVLDVRRHRGGTDGLHAIPKLAFHLYRLEAREVRGVTPRALASRRFTVDPSGRDVPLFAPRARSADPDARRAAREWELPGPIRCRLLAHAEHLLSEAALAALALPAASTAALRRLVGRRFPHERGFLRAVDALAPAPLTAVQRRSLLAATLVEDCGKRRLLPDAIRVEESGAVVPRERTAAGSLDGWSATAAGQRLVVDPERGRLRFLGAAPGPVVVSYHEGFVAPIGAGTYQRRALERTAATLRIPSDAPDLTAAASIDGGGVTEIEDSRTYTPVADKSGIVDATIRAANGERPFVELAGPWTLATGAAADSQLLLDGLWVGGGRELRLQGDWQRVTIAHATLDPGGEDADGAAIDPTELVVEGTVEELILAAAILGPVRTTGAGAVERLVVEDSVVGPVDLPRTEAELARVTVLGDLALRRLQATETLVAGTADIADTQSGCFRFGAAREGSRLPRRYRSHDLADDRALFASRRFGDPGYARLSEAAPEAIRRGAESRSEIGAFSAVLAPLRADALRAKVDEFLPFGLIPVYVAET